ncbi:MAG: glycosyltransferase family 4 protein [Deltaproteobacteria bacterium]|nr:glycosyltransferase family 4 protein [Deltaproteobacteria bacterium]
MRVAFLPHFPLNPYQRELAKALGRIGANVTLPAERATPLELLGKHGRFDVLHLHWLHDLVLAGRFRRLTARKSSRFLAGLLAHKALGTRLAWTIHNVVEHERRDPEAELLVYRALAHVLDVMFVHCDRAAEEVTRAYRISAKNERKLRVIRHAHYADVYASAIDRREARARLGYEDEDVVFLHFGQLRPYKDVPALFSAFGRLESPRARLLLVGRAPKDETLALPSDSRIRAITSFVPDGEVALYFRAADVAVLPFARVLTSGSLVLAMSFGLPVITPSLGCIPETVPLRGGFSYVDERELAPLMARMVDADRKSMGAENLRAALATSFDDMARKTDDGYRGVKNPRSW